MTNRQFYLSRVGDRPAVQVFEPPADAYIAGPFTSVDDAFEALQEYELKVSRNAAAWEMIFSVAAWLALGALVWVVLS